MPVLGRLQKTGTTTDVPEVWDVDVDCGWDVVVENVTGAEDDNEEEEEELSTGNVLEEEEVDTAALEEEEDVERDGSLVDVPEGEGDAEGVVDGAWLVEEVGVVDGG